MGTRRRTDEDFADEINALFEQFAHDLRYACRGLAQSRAFVASTVLTLAAGMGLVVVVFTIFNAYAPSAAR